MKRSRSTLLGLALVLVTMILPTCCAANASFFDGFDGEASYSNWNGWGPEGWQSISDGQLTMIPPTENDGLWVSSNQLFLYGDYEIRFRTENAPWNRLYMGFFSRSPWANPIACMRMDVNLMLAAGDGVDSNWDALSPNSPYVTPNVWHTLKILWRPDSIETIYDGVSLGVFSQYVPSTAMPIVLDAHRGGAGSTEPLVFEVDYVKVTPIPEPGTLVSLFAMSGLFGLTIRRRMR